MNFSRDRKTRACGVLGDLIKKAILPLDSLLIISLNARNLYTKSDKGYNRFFEHNEQLDPAFDLFLVAIIACEISGFYRMGAKDHIRSLEKSEKTGQRPQQPDPGSYTMEFIMKHFPPGYFKNLHKVLTDRIRHSLAHSLGVIDTQGKGQESQRIVIWIDRKNPEKEIEVDRDRPVMLLNSAAFATQAIKAFEDFLRKVKRGDKEIIDNILKADSILEKDMAKIYPPGRGVQNQFQKVYEQALKEGLIHSK